MLKISNIKQSDDNKDLSVNNKIKLKTITDKERELLRIKAYQYLLP